MTPHSRSESARLQALDSFHILDTLPEQDYEDLTQLAASICQTPVALISLVDHKRQWFKSVHGLGVQETPRELSFCAHAIQTPDQPMVVTDARIDERFKDNALVTGDPHIVFYAGAPLVDEEGNALGSLCVIDRESRELSVHQLSSLKILSRQVMRLLELRRKSYQLEQSQALYQQENMALQRSQKRFETVFNHAPIGLGLLSGDDHVFELVNDRIAEMAGRTSLELQGKPLLEALPELSRQGLKELFDQVRDTKKRFVAPEIPIQLVRGGKLETAYFYASFEPVLEAEGKVSIVDFSLEITDQILAQRALQASETRFRTMIEQSPMAIGQLRGRDFVIEIGNPKLFEVWGKEPSIVGQRLIEALPELKSQPFIGILEQVYDTGVAYYGNDVQTHLVRQGVLENVYFDFSYTPLKNAEDEVTGILIMAIEVTSQALARKQLLKSEARFKGLIENSPFALGLYEGPDLVISVANEAILGMWGKTKAVVGQKIMDALPELIGQPFIPLLQQVYRTGIAYKSTEQAADLIVNGTLQRFYFNFVYQPLFNEQGEVYAILNSAIDVTERFRARENLAESQQRYKQLAEELEQRVSQRTQELEKANQELRRSNDHLQQFAYVASHDLQEPLRKIQTFGSLLEKRLGLTPDGQTSHLIQRINLASSRMSTLITDLLNYSRLATQEADFDWVSLDAVLVQALDTLSLVIRERRVHIDVQELGRLRGNFTQLHQLFQNLLSNAIKFTPPDQEPRIHISHQLVSRSELPAQAHFTPGASQFHKIGIRDQGTGFDEKFAEKIFMVFQRLHDQKEYPGTGIGLAICRRVVENHGGLLTVQSQPGAGSTFTIYLPAS